MIDNVKTISDERIEYKYEWVAHGFFDDGGGEEGLKKWTLNVIN